MITSYTALIVTKYSFEYLLQLYITAQYYVPSRL